MVSLTLLYLQFCEWLSTSAGRDRAGPIVDLLLEYVGSVQLCARITELLDSREDWAPIRHKTRKWKTKAQP